jgi:uroporphyrin-III C-methyltransferase
MAHCVYLVGAGPGDPELLTVRAARLLTKADAIFHDDLVPDAILKLASDKASIVDVGHRAGDERRPVRDVVDAMTALARQGQLVVRLKGGDPFLFARGGEEAAGLLDAGVPFEIVPGISSALAGPAAGGIPLTHRDLASSVTIVTGHERGRGGRVRWEVLATGADTLVVMMGASRLRSLAASIIAAGRSPSTPAAVVMAATLPEQRHVVATLATIADAARDARIASPAVLVVGEVVALSQVLAGRTLAYLAAAG